MIKKIVCIGNTIQLPEYCLHNERFKILAIICEKKKLDNELFTYSLVRNIALITVEDKRQLFEEIQKFEGVIDFGIMYSFGIILNKDVLNLLNVYNIHPSLLPCYKGRHPTFWSIVSNDLKFGISLHIVEKEVDEGAIISQKLVELYYWENHIDLMNKLVSKVPELLSDLISFIDLGADTIPNPKGHYFPPVDEKITSLNINHSPSMIYNIVRAQAQYGGAFFEIDNRKFLIRKIQFENSSDFSFIQNGVIFEIRNCVYVKHSNSMAIKLLKYKEIMQ